MEIFKIRQTNPVGTNTNTPPKVESETPPNSAVENAVPTVNEGGAPAPKTPPVETPTEEGKEKTAIVAVSGPIGNLYTEALNRTLALTTESYMFQGMHETLPTVNDTHDAIVPGEEALPEGSVLEVLAFQGDKLSYDDVVRVSNLIRHQEQRDFVIVMEGISQMRKEACYMADLGMYQHVKVAYTREKAMELIRDHVKKEVL